MNKIDTLIAYLFAIQAFAKDIHYSASGEAFYSKHLLADEIYKGIDEQIDALVETCILPYNTPMQIDEYWESARGIIPSAIDFRNLKGLIKDAITIIESQERIRTAGEKSLIDSIAQDLQRKLGLITRQVG
jgi:DNA-binding ferritin-like protein